MKRKTIRWKDKVLVAGPNGWTGWQYPRHNGYAMSCCDCGLVHQMVYEVFREQQTGNWWLVRRAYRTGKLGKVLR